MPIIRNGDEIFISYTIPKHIKILITDDFLKEFRNQLFRINNYGLDDFAEYGIPASISTAGWEAAFGKACLLTHKEELFDYWRALSWYDSDLFEDQIANLLIEKRLILTDLSKIIEEQLGIKEENLRICDECGKVYHKKMVQAIDGGDFHICLFCKDAKQTKDGESRATDYYRNILKELDEYCSKNPLKQEQK